MHLGDPLLHLLIVALCLFCANVFAQTLPYACPTGQMISSELANTGSVCSIITYSNISGVPSLSPVATSGAYSSLSGLPTIPAVQLQSDYTEANTSLLDYIKNKPTIPVVQSYENTTQRLNPILINKSSTVAGGAGNAVFNLTADGTSGGTALCPNGVMLNSPNLSVNDATAPYQFGWTWSNSNKTMTVLAQKASGLAVLTFTLLGLPAPVPNGTSVNSTVICY